MRFHRFLFTISCLISLSVLSVPGQTSFSTFETRPGVSHPEVRDIDSAKASLTAFTTSLYGRISVSVLIDEDGNVSSVESVSGPGNICASVTRPDVVAVRDAAATAARMVKFVPAKLGDQPTTSEGLLYFDIGKPEPAQKDDGEKRYFSASNASDKVAGKDQPEKVAGERYTASGRSTADFTTKNESLTIGHLFPGSKAISLPKPPYPPAARAVRASGPVTIQVLIDTDGSVFSSEAISGHPLLRAAARNAACGARFSPTVLSSQPVKVSGLITYNFVP